MKLSLKEIANYCFKDESALNSSLHTDVIQDRPQSPASYYDSSKSFFDSISCEAIDRDKNRRYINKICIIGVFKLLPYF